MTAEMLGQTDRNYILGALLPELAHKDLFFTDRDASVIRTGSDHGADWYIITGLMEANSFCEFVVHVAWADDVLVTILQIPEDGDEPFVRPPIVLQGVK